MIFQDLSVRMPKSELLGKIPQLRSLVSEPFYRVSRSEGAVHRIGKGGAAIPAPLGWLPEMDA